MDSVMSQPIGESLVEIHSDWIKSVLRKYDVSWEHGFISEKEPLLQFPDPYFLIWDEILQDLTTLIQKRQLRKTVQKMPLLDHTRLDGLQEWQRADMVLSVIVNAYVWQNGEHEPLNVIPKCLAIPLFAVAEHIGCSPIASHCNCVLTNWKIIDKTRPLDMSNVDTLFSFTGDKGEHWFFMVALQLELDAVPGIRSVVAAQKAVIDNDTSLLEISLISLKQTIEKLKSTLSRMHEGLDPGFMHFKLRVFFAGWRNNKALPNGMIYEGVSSEPFKFAGGSGAQSSVFQTFDAALGVVHPREKDGEPSFLEIMLQHMPRGHREFILFVKTGPSICEYIKKMNDDHLKDLFNACLESLKQFRSYHIQVVARYVITQAAKAKRNNAEVLGKRGTGGTEIMPFLKGSRKDTVEAQMTELTH